jgi:hypothetical protein
MQQLLLEIEKYRDILKEKDKYIGDINKVYHESLHNFEEL